MAQEAEFRVMDREVPRGREAVDLFLMTVNTADRGEPMSTTAAEQLNTPNRFDSSVQNRNDARHSRQAAVLYCVACEAKEV